MKTGRKRVIIAAAVLAIGAVVCAIWMDMRHEQDPAEAKARRLVAEFCWLVDEEPPSLWDRLLAKLGLTDDLSHLNLDQIRYELTTLGESAVPPLVEALQEGNPKIRVNLIPVLGKMGPAAKKAVPTLIAALTDYSEEMFWSFELHKSAPTRVWWQARDALVELGRRGTGIAKLTEALKHDNWRVRSSAAEILGRIGNPAEAAVPALQQAMKDKSEGVRKAAAEALKKIQQVGASTRRRRAQHK